MLTGRRQRLLVRRVRIGPDLLQSAHHLRPRHVRVLDPLIAQRHRPPAHRPAHVDRLRVHRRARPHQPIDPIHRVAVDHHQTHVGLDARDEVAVHVLLAPRDDDQIRVQTRAQPPQTVAPADRVRRIGRRHPAEVLVGEQPAQPRVIEQVRHLHTFSSPRLGPRRRPVRPRQIPTKRGASTPPASSTSYSATNEGSVPSARW